MKIFLSYTRKKDEFNVVSDFQRHLVNELKLYVPNATLFQDKNEIGAGDDFSEVITEELDAADVLLILVSNAWLLSDWGRREFELFTKKERDSGREPRVLPVLWVSTPELKNPDDAIAKELDKIQYEDWRDLRHENWQNPNIRMQVAKLAERVVAIAMREIRS